MEKSYGLACCEIVSSLGDGGMCLDCGANEGDWYEKLSKETQLLKDQYHGIEWNGKCAAIGHEKGLNIQKAGLNKVLPYQDDTFTCGFALSVLEHLLNGCHFLREGRRALKKDGKLVLLTPNISSYFNAVLFLAGKMPSSRPHPDSDILMKAEEVYKVNSDNLTYDTENDQPVHRHLLVFSYRVLKKYLKLIGFSDEHGTGFGVYPLPNIVQPIFENIDPYHCHQMVFIARK